MLDLKAESHILIDIEVRKQSISLEHRVKWPLVWREVGNIPSVEEYLTLCGFLKSCYHSQQSGLATTRWAKYSYKLSPLDIEAHIFQDFLAVEYLADVFNLDDRDIFHFLRFCYINYALNQLIL